MPAEAYVSDGDHDRDVSQYVRGPGRPKRPNRDPIIELYPAGSLEIPCPDCHAEPRAFCRHPSGALRKTPCGGRKPPRPTTPDPKDAQ